MLAEIKSYRFGYIITSVIILPKKRNWS
uniref:Uncharacterized protein n=1 Tax=Rhizophora mucronata TaxID=61149 RepID=A0A2P2PHY0_RHIMU